MHRLLLLTTLLTATAFAQSPMPACDGDPVIVRLSHITPNGTMAGFLAASAAHKAWYRANGVTDNDIVVARIIVHDEKTGERKYSETDAMSYHIHPPARSRTPNQGDEAWKTFVKQYRDNSEIKYEYTTCMPKGVLAKP